MANLEKSKKSEIKNAQDFHKLIKRLNTANPAEKDVELWRKEISEKPELLNTFSNTLGIAENEVMSTIENFLYAETARNELKNIRDNLGYTDAPEIERLLIKQICVNWLRLNVLTKVTAAKFRESHTTEAGLYFDKLSHSANVRFNRTMETLAKVKNLLADAELKRANAKVKMLRAEEMERKLLPPGDVDYIDAETFEN